MNNAYEELREWAIGAMETMRQLVSAKHAPDVVNFFEDNVDDFLSNCFRNDSFRYFFAPTGSNSADLRRRKYSSFEDFNSIGCQFIEGYHHDVCSYDENMCYYIPIQCYGIIKVNGKYYRVDWTYASHGGGDYLPEVLEKVVHQVTPVEKTVIVFEPTN